MRGYLKGDGKVFREYTDFTFTVKNTGKNLRLSAFVINRRKEKAPCFTRGLAGFAIDSNR